MTKYLLLIWIRDWIDTRKLVLRENLLRDALHPSISSPSWPPWELIPPKGNKELAKYGITNYERFSAIIPKFDNIPKFYVQALMEKYPHKKINMKQHIIASYGCRVSHLEVIKIALKRNYKNILIFEDDIAFKPERIDTFNKAIQELQIKPIKWDIFYLGGSIEKRINLRYTNISKITNCLSCHAYAISAQHYKNIIQNLGSYKYEIDCYL